MTDIETINLGNEKVYLKKGKFGYRIVHPLRDQHNKIIWINFLFGGYANLITLLVYIGILIIYYIGTNELISSYKIIADDPCQFCGSCGELIKNITKPVTNWHLRA